MIEYFPFYSVQSSTGEVYSFANNEWKKFMLPHGYHLPSRHATCSVADSIYASGGVSSRLIINPF